MSDPVYERLVPAPNPEFVIHVVEQGLGDFVGTFGGRDFIGYPRQQRFTDSAHVTKIPGGLAPPDASALVHGVEWWNLLDPHEAVLEHTHTVDEAKIAFLRTRNELLKRRLAERRFICITRWENGAHAELEWLG